MTTRLTIENLRSRREKIAEIARKHCAENVRVFGSVARNESDKGSDIDFLVTFRPGATLFDQVGIIEELTGILGKSVDVVSDRALNPYLRDRILEEACPL